VQEQGGCAKAAVGGEGGDDFEVCREFVSEAITSISAENGGGEKRGLGCERGKGARREMEEQGKGVTYNNAPSPPSSPPSPSQKPGKHPHTIPHPPLPATQAYHPHHRRHSLSLPLHPHEWEHSISRTR